MTTVQGHWSSSADVSGKQSDKAPPPVDSRKSSEVDLSGRHLERIPTSLFSSLHLTTLNLSHNLLAPSSLTTSSATCSIRRRNPGKGRKRRERRRRPSESRETSKARPRPFGSEEVPSDSVSGDSGVPPDPVEEEEEEPEKKQQTEKSDQIVPLNTVEIKPKTGVVKLRRVPECSSANATKPKDEGPVWINLAEELQAKLKYRRAISEGLPVPESQAPSNEVSPNRTAPSAVNATSKVEIQNQVLKPRITNDIALAKDNTRETNIDKPATETCKLDNNDAHEDPLEDERETESDSCRSSSCDESDHGSEGLSCVSRSGKVPATQPRSLGGLDNLKHFLQLQVVVLSQNGLREFPECLLCLPALVRLDLSRNHLCSLPDTLDILNRLAELEVSYNKLVGVGTGVAALPALTHLNAAYNHLNTTQHLSAMEHLRHLDLTGNRMKEIPFAMASKSLPLKESALRECLLFDPNEAEKGKEEDLEGGGKSEGEPLTLNLRLNNLTGPVTLASIQNVTELDVSDNGISSLDVSCLTCLTSLVCSNNTITTITLHGATLTALVADNNKLSCLEVRYHPRRLTKIVLARNQISAVPPWLVSSTETTLVDISHNLLSCLPAFLTSGHLRRLHTLSAHHNRLTVITIPQRSAAGQRGSRDQSPYTPYGETNGPYRPSSQNGGHQSSIQGDSLHEEPRLCSIEVLLLQHNKLAALPPNLFAWLNRLRVLNVSANQMKALPSICEVRGGRECHPEEDVGGSKVTVPLQEFYAAANNLRDLTPLQHCRALRILHAPYNRISSLQDRLIWSWELLEELVLSGNNLTSVPPGVSRLRRLRMLKVHSNPLRSLPRLAHLSVLKVVDASHCQLGRVELEEVVSPGLVALDISANTALSLDHHQFTKCKSRRAVSVVDVTSRCGRSLPLTRPKAQKVQRGDGQGAEGQDSTPKLPWSLGFSESIGRDSRLTVGQLRVPDVGGLGKVGIAAVADGGQEVGSVSSLLSALPTLLQEERACSHTHTYSLKYALLTALRRLRSQGATLPAAVCAAHLESDPSHPHQFPVLRLCCYGSVSAAVTTVHSKPVILTTTAPKVQKMELTKCYEGSRCILAEAPTIPDPHTTELHLGPNHTGVIIASASFWEVISPEEAGDICSEVPEPGLAAKRLLDLAQAYGSRQALSVIVVRLIPPPPIPVTHAPVIVGSKMRSKTSGIERARIPSRENLVENLENECPEKFSQVDHEDERISHNRIRFDRKSVAESDRFSKQNNLETRRDRQYNAITTEKESHGAPHPNEPHSSLASRKGKVKQVNSNLIDELDRSSPSGQSHSDNSEHDTETHRHLKGRALESNMLKQQHKALCKSIEDLYAKPHRRKRDSSITSDSSKSMESSQRMNNHRKTITYYHYPRPDPSVPPPKNHLTDHLLSMNQMGPPAGVLAPPAGFGDPESDSEGSDSGLSGVSGGHQTSGQKNLPDDDSLDGQEQVTEEQFRSWEYLLARNAKLLFMRELDTLTRPNSRASNFPTASAPDLLAATASAETESNSGLSGGSGGGQFLRNTVRKSRLGRGTFRLIQNKLSATTSKISTLQRFRSSASSSKTESNFRRFGSLQNLKYYQQNRPRPPHYPLVQPDLGAEMQERPTLDSLELETRMQHYWHTGVTNF